MKKSTLLILVIWFFGLIQAQNYTYFFNTNENYDDIVHIEYLSFLVSGKMGTNYKVYLGKSTVPKFNRTIGRTGVDKFYYGRLDEIVLYRGLKNRDFGNICFDSQYVRIEATNPLNIFPFSSENNLNAPFANPGYPKTTTQESYWDYFNYQLFPKTPFGSFSNKPYYSMQQHAIVGQGNTYVAHGVLAPYANTLVSYMEHQNTNYMCVFSAEDGLKIRFKAKIQPANAEPNMHVFTNGFVNDSTYYFTLNKGDVFAPFKTALDISGSSITILNNKKHQVFNGNSSYFHEFFWKKNYGHTIFPVLETNYTAERIGTSTSQLFPKQACGKHYILLADNRTESKGNLFQLGAKGFPWQLNQSEEDKLKTFYYAVFQVVALEDNTTIRYRKKTVVLAKAGDTYGDTVLSTLAITGDKPFQLVHIPNEMRGVGLYKLPCAPADNVNRDTQWLFSEQNLPVDTSNIINKNHPRPYKFPNVVWVTAPENKDNIAEVYVNGRYKRLRFKVDGRHLPNKWFWDTMSFPVNQASWLFSPTGCFSMYAAEVGGWLMQQVGVTGAAIDPKYQYVSINNQLEQNINGPKEICAQTNTNFKVEIPWYKPLKVWWKIGTILDSGSNINLSLNNIGKQKLTVYSICNVLDSGIFRTDSTTLWIHVFESPSIIKQRDTSLCSNSSFVLNAGNSAGITSWSTKTQVLCDTCFTFPINASKQTYYVKSTKAFCQTKYDSITIDTFKPLSITLNVADSLCFATLDTLKIVLDSNLVHTKTWFINGLASKNLTFPFKAINTSKFIVNAQDNCAKIWLTDSVIIKVPAPLQIIGNPNITHCQGDFFKPKFTVLKGNAVSNTKLYWINYSGNDTIINQNTKLIAVANDGCSKPDTAVVHLKITNLATLKSSVFFCSDSVDIQLFCNGLEDSTLLLVKYAQKQFMFQIKTKDTTRLKLPYLGESAVELILVNNCGFRSYSYSPKLIQIPNLDSFVVDNFCFGQTPSLNIYAKYATKLVWQTNKGIDTLLVVNNKIHIQNVPVGNFTYQLSNHCGKTIFKTEVIKTASLPPASDTSYLVCIPKNVEIILPKFSTGKMQFNNTFYTYTATNKVLIPVNKTGLQKLVIQEQVYDQKYCSYRTVNMVAEQTPIADFSIKPMQSVYQNNDITLVANPANTYLWNIANRQYFSQNIQTRFADSGVHSIFLKLNNGFCTDSISKSIYVHGPFAVYIPNALNLNSTNNVFKPFVENGILEEIIIFNRWGQMVFKDNKPWQPNSELPAGVYVYKITAKSYNNKMFTTNGTLTILK